jgi:hypothetical protein
MPHLYIGDGMPDLIKLRIIKDSVVTADKKYDAMIDYVFCTDEEIEFAKGLLSTGVAVPIELNDEDRAKNMQNKTLKDYSIEEIKDYLSMQGYEGLRKVREAKKSNLVITNEILNMDDL